MSAKFFFIAGEPSGDVLGGALIKALKARDSTIEITGVGGNQMKNQGLDSLVPMEELCVMGLWEVIGQLPRLMRMINSMVEEIMEQKPDMVVTIDLPDFNFRVAERLKKAGFEGKIVHYVAPTVWAWRPGRAKKVAEYLDGMMCLFPFEPEHFTEHGLSAVYVGHPLIEVNRDEIDSKGFCEEFDIPSDITKVGIFFGSRQAEFKKIGPVLIEAIEMLYEQNDNFCLIAPTLPDMEMEITNLANDLPCTTYVLTNQERKWEAFKSCDMAIAVSGTVGLELAYLGIPHVIAYQVHPISWLILKFLVKVEYAHLGNILLDKSVVDECLQNQCTPYNIAKPILDMMTKPEALTEKREALDEIHEKLGAGDTAFVPSEQAANYLFGILNK